jgi:hypothetical protein
LGCHGSRLSTVQTPLGWRRSIPSKSGGAPDCHQSRQNLTVRFAKPDHLVSAVSSRAIQSLFILCDNTFWRLHWGLDYFKHVKHEGWKLRPQRIRPQQGQHPQCHLQHHDGGGSQGVRSLPRRSRRALPLTLRSNAVGDYSLGYYTDRLHQARGNTRGTA